MARPAAIVRLVTAFSLLLALAMPARAQTMRYAGIVRSFDGSSLVLDDVGPGQQNHPEVPIIPRTIAVTPRTAVFVTIRAEDANSGFPGDYPRDPRRRRGPQGGGLRLRAVSPRGPALPGPQAHHRADRPVVSGRRAVRLAGLAAMQLVVVAALAAVVVSGATVPHTHEAPCPASTTRSTTLVSWRCPAGARCPSSSLPCRSWTSPRLESSSASPGLPARIHAKKQRGLPLAPVPGPQEGTAVRFQIAIIEAQELPT